MLQGLGPGKAQEEQEPEGEVDPEKQLMMSIFGHPHQEPNEHVLREVLRKIDSSASKEEQNWVMEEVRKGWFSERGAWT